MLDLTRKIDPVLAAKDCLHWRNRCRAGDLPKLACLIDDSSQINVSLDFALLDDDVPAITGHIHAQLILDCQRCAETMQMTLNCAPALAYVGNRALIDRIGDDFEVIVSDDNKLSLADLVSDEILLALPMVPKHAHNCLPAQYRRHRHIVRNPFSEMVARQRDLSTTS